MVTRFRPNLIHVYLHPEEDKCVRNYAEGKFLTVSELIRGWIHEVMKREGYEIKEPSLPKSNLKLKKLRIKKLVK